MRGRASSSWNDPRRDSTRKSSIEQVHPPTKVELAPAQVHAKRIQICGHVDPFHVLLACGAVGRDFAGQVLVRSEWEVDVAAFGESVLLPVPGIELDQLEHTVAIVTLEFRQEVTSRAFTKTGKGIWSPSRATSAALSSSRVAGAGMPVLRAS